MMHEFNCKQVDILISKNQGLQMLYPKHHAYETSQIIMDKKVTKSTKMWSPQNTQIYPTVQDNTTKHKMYLITVQAS